MKTGEIIIPAGAAHILDTLHGADFSAYIVGGCVRDALMNRTPNDWDITTSARPDEVKGLFKRTVDTGIKHGTVTVLTHGDSFEVTTYRSDGDYSDHRHPDSVYFTDELKEDLRRRDFTVNAMAYSQDEGVIDVSGGIEDLRDCVIRAVGDPEQRFEEDALRMMRAVRFAAQLDFKIDDKTRQAAAKLAPTLSAVSGERIRDELEKLLLSDHPEKMRDLYELGLTTIFFPEFGAMMETAQNNPHHKYTVGEHTIAALCASKKDRLLRLAVLLHDVAKPVMKTTDEEGIDHFKGHPAKGASIAGKILRRWREDNKTIARVKNIITWHDLRPESDSYSVRKTAARVGREDFPLLLDMMEADVKGQSTYLQKEKLERLDEIRLEWARVEAAAEPIELKDLAVSGSDLIERGVNAGPGVGEKLREMLAEVIRDPSHNDRDYLLDRFTGKKKVGIT